MKLLSAIVFLPLLGAALVTLSSLLPARLRDNASRAIALIVSAVCCALGIYVWLTFDPHAAGMQFVERVTWIRSLGVEYFVGVDGLSVSLLILSTLISFIATLASMPFWSREQPTGLAQKIPGYCAMLLLLQTGMSGTFVALDGFLFFVFWEVMLLPMYFLIGIWGGQRREYAAIKFFLYTLAGSVLLLIAIIALYQKSGDQSLLNRLAEQSPQAFQRLVESTLHHDAATGSWGYLLGDGTFSDKTFNLLAWARTGQAGLFDLAGAFFLGFTFVKVIWVFLFIAFAVKVPMFPFHTWLPDAHVEAPTPISVILAGVLLKMGIYGMLRFNWAVLPAATLNYQRVVAVFAVINILYAGLICLAQKDLKRLIAYSSVSHMGFSLLGMAAMTDAGMSGAVLNLFTHGLISPLLFLVVGVLYDRAHHREIDGFGGLARVLPEYTGVMALAFFASLGLPGLAGFVSEFLVLSGSFAPLPWHTALATISVVITAAYYLWALQRVFLGPLNPKYQGLGDLSWRERLTLYPLVALIILFGVYPAVMLGLIDPGLHEFVRTLTAS
ncbi:MAG: NuoM family protein [Myxococcaceae bacterium]